MDTPQPVVPVGANQIGIFYNCTDCRIHLNPTGRGYFLQGGYEPYLKGRYVRVLDDGSLEEVPAGEARSC